MNKIGLHNRFKKLLLMLVIVIGMGLSSTPIIAQNMGLSFSYFLPKNGYFSNPVSPFSVRGIGLNFNDYVGVQTGFSFYSIPGMHIDGLPFEHNKPLYGPSFSFLVPLELVLSIGNKKFEFSVKGGGFGFFNIGHRLNMGNFDRAIRNFESWSVANADLNYKNNPGWGTMIGTELVFYLTNQFGLSFEVNYLQGNSKLELAGEYTGGNIGSPLETKEVTYDDAVLDFTGWEFSIGIIFTGGR